VIPVLVPKIPEARELLPYLQQIDNSRIYSNFGPLHRKFASGLGALTNASGIALTSNGTTAIELALRALDLPRDGYCFMPAYTFIASAHAVANAGLIPHFLDVDEQSLALTPEIVARALDETSIKPAVILVVSAHGAPMDIDNWDRFSDSYNIPVVFDGAAAITTITRVGKAPICVSLHATKTLGIGEGGAVLTSDAGLCERITAMTGFGFTGAERVSNFRGGNYRISEYAAAVGLAALDALPARVLRLNAAAACYRSALANKRTRMQENMGQQWVSATLNVRLPADAVEETTKRLDSSAIAWRRWWGYGCHTHPAFAHSSCEDLSITAKVASEIIGLPFYEDIKQHEIQKVVDCLA
jgi:dTDP-4-amino-4,6-dideoxygalactose transaminase